MCFTAETPNIMLSPTMTNLTHQRVCTGISEQFRLDGVFYDVSNGIPTLYLLQISMECGWVWLSLWVS